MAGLEKSLHRTRPACSIVLPNQRLNLTELAESVHGRLKLLSRLGH
jgi:hypothetical protein